MQQIRQSGAGLLQERIALDKRIDASDGYGNVVSTWLEEFQCRAEFVWLRGGEAVMAARLESRQPVVARVRRSSDTMRITPDWQMRDVRTGEAYNVRAVTPDPSRAILDLLVESGGAT